MLPKLGNIFAAGLILTLTADRVAADAVESLLTQEMSEHHVVGMTCLVIQDGQTRTQFYSGSANLEWPSPVDAQTVFEIGSVSKQFAAASVLLLDRRAHV